ncbi:hypothetical protein ACP70R_025239 [Stipagrostis hirtigluma subsp. patula]
MLLGHKLWDGLTGRNKEAWKEGRIRGTAVLGAGHAHASLLDDAHRFLDKDNGVTFELVSATVADPGNEGKGVVGKPAHLEDAVVSLKSMADGEFKQFIVNFEWDESQGIPGAVIVKNHMKEEIFFKRLTLEGVPAKDTIVFVAHSWIKPIRRHTDDSTQIHPHTDDSAARVFFTNDNGKSERRLPLRDLMSIYVPRDERFGHLKMSDFLGYSLKTVIEAAIPTIDNFIDMTPNEFDSFDEILRLYEIGPEHVRREVSEHNIGLRTGKFSDHNFGWRTDDEFAREMLAGVNPMIIRRLTEFPAKSALDPSKYGDRTSKITEADINQKLEGLTVLDDDGTLKPLAIELSLPHDNGKHISFETDVYTPADTGVDGYIWQLAKAYACVNDSAWHQLISHWLNTHAVMEPFVIATNRQLSVVHPVHKLLSPHYRYTMHINALYALEMSSEVYKNWNLTEQALPVDLVKRGVAELDPSSPYKVRLLIKDYPYARDGLLIWWAIELWVKEYLGIYYPNDGELRRDTELQAWWKEVREVGHGDLKDRTWWPKMETVEELARTCTTIIWVASALHAAVNFGQYLYAGYFPNRPTVSRRPMPKPNTKEYRQLEHGGEEADKVFIRTITSQLQTIVGISLLEVLSKHSPDEMYLGQRVEPKWTSDAKALEASKRFGERLKQIEERIVKENEDPAFKNRKGPVEMPYMLLYPNPSDFHGANREGNTITAIGIPNSVSI